MSTFRTPTVLILSILLVLNIALSLWGLYNNRISHARICQSIAAVNDRIMTKLDGTVYDKATAGIHVECIGNSLFLVPGFSKKEIAEIMTPAPKCPDEYGTDDAGSAEYLASMDTWTNNFYDLHRDATLTDWSAARYQFYIDNNCTAALQRHQDATDGKADPEAMKQVEVSIREAIDGQSQP